MERPEHVTEITCTGNELRCVGKKEVLACHCCEYSCSEETSMILHLVHHHDFTDTSAESQVTGFLYEGNHYCCQACAFLSPSRLMFQEHIRCHTFATPYTCAACSQAVNLKYVLAHYRASHSKTLAPAIHVASSTLVNEIMQKLGPAAPFSISEIPISPQHVKALESPHSAKNGDVDRPDSCHFASPDSSERSEEPLPSVQLTDCQLLQVLVTNCNYTDGTFVCGLCKFATQYLPVISKHLHADVQRWNCNCVGCRSSHYSNCIVITAAMTKLKKKKLQMVGKEEVSTRAGPVSPMVIAAVSSDPELNQGNAAVCSNQPFMSLQQEYGEKSKPKRSKTQQSSVDETTEMAQAGPEGTSEVTSSTPCLKEGKKVQTVKLLCDLVDDTYVCKSCKFYEKDAALFRKHLWDDIHQYGDCTHNGRSSSSGVDNNECTILNSLMQMLLFRKNDSQRGIERNENTRMRSVEGTADVHVERSRTRNPPSRRSNPNEPRKASMTDGNEELRHEDSSGSETAENVQQQIVSDEKDTHNQDVNVTAVSSDNGVETDNEKSEFFRCGFINCRSSYSAVVGLKKHILTAHKSMTVYPCPYCSCLWPDYSHLMEHIPAHAGPTPYRCVQCDVCFEKNVLLKDHLNTMHRVNKLFRCTIDGCEFVSNIWTEFKMHNFTFHPSEDSYTCFACDTKLTSLSTYFWHIESGLVTLICCSYCPMKSKMRHTILRHSNSVHQGLELKVTVQTEVKCATEPDLTQPKAFHTKHSSEQLVLYTCDSCDFASENKLTVTEHIKSHELDSSCHCAFCCSLCPFGTAGLKGFNAHVANHRGKTTHHFRYYKCTHCLYTSNQMVLIEKHLQDKHANILFKFEVQQEIVIGKDSNSEVQHVVMRGKSKSSQSEIQDYVVTNKEVQKDVLTSKGTQSEIQKDDLISKECQSGVQKDVRSNVTQSGVQKDVTSKGSQARVQKEVSVKKSSQSGEQQEVVRDKDTQSDVQQQQQQKVMAGMDSSTKVQEEGVKGYGSPAERKVISGNGSKSIVQEVVSGSRSKMQKEFDKNSGGMSTEQKKGVESKGSSSRVHKEITTRKGMALEVQKEVVTGKDSQSEIQKEVVTGKGSTQVVKEVVTSKGSLVERAQPDSTMPEHGTTVLPDCACSNLKQSVTPQSSKHHSESSRSVTSTTGGITLKRKLVILLERCDVPSDSVPSKEVNIKKELVDEAAVSSEFLSVIQSVKTEIEEDSPAQDFLDKDSIAIERFHCELCVFSCSEWSRLHEHIKACHGNVTQWNNVSLSVTTTVNVDSSKPPQIRPSKSTVRDAEERNDEVARETDTAGRTHEEMRYHCNLCPFVCELWKTFQVHMVGEHSYRAIKVDMTLPFQNIMAIPIEKPKPIASKFRHGQFVCDKCSFSTDVKSNFWRHKRGHSQKLKSGFKCTYCSYSSAHKFVTTKHVKNCHPDKPFVQPHVVSLQARKMPTISMANEQTRVCTRQAKSTPAIQSSITSEPATLEQEPDLKSDTQNQECCDEHVKRDSTGSSSTTVETSTYCTRVDNHDLYQCRQCEFLHRFPSKVRRHSNYCHTKHCPYQCGYCDFRSVESGKVKRHCGFAHRGQLPKVIKVNVDAKTSQPVGVLMSGSQKNDDIETEEEGEKPTEDSQWYWRRHVKTSDNQMMNCRLCGYRQVGASALKRHILSIHLGFSPFACKYCSFATTEIRYARQHIEKTHPGLACKVIRRKYVSESSGEVDNEHPASAAMLGVTVGRAMSATAMADVVPTKDTPTEPSSTCGVSTTLVTETDKGYPSFANVSEPVSSESLPDTPSRKKHNARYYKCIYCDFYSEDRFIFDIRDHIFVAHLHRNHFMCVHCRFSSMKKEAVVAHNLNTHPNKDNTVKEDKAYLRNIAVLETHGQMRMVGVLSDDKVPLIELPSNDQNEKLLCSKPLDNGPASEGELVTNSVALNDVVSTDPLEPCTQTVSGHVVTMNTRSLRSDKSQTPTPTLPTRSKDEQESASPSNSVSSLKLDNDAHRSNVLTSCTQHSSERDTGSQILTSSAPKRGSNRLRITTSSPRLPKEDSVSQTLSSSTPTRGSDRLKSTNYVQMLPVEDSNSQRSTSPSSSIPKRSSGRLSSRNDVVAKLLNEESGSQKTISPFSSTKRGRDRLRSSIPRLPKDDSDSQRSTSPFSSTKRDSNRTRSCRPNLPNDDSDSQRNVSPSSSTKAISNRLRRSMPKLPNEDNNSQRSSSPSGSTTMRGRSRPSRTNHVPEMLNKDGDSQGSAFGSTKRGSDRLRSSTQKLPKKDSDSHRSRSSAKQMSTGNSGSHRGTSSTKKLPTRDIDVNGNTSCISSISKSVTREIYVQASTVLKKKLKLKRNTDDLGVYDIRGKESDTTKKALKSDVDEMYKESVDSVVSWKCKTCGLQLPKLEKMRRHILTHHLNMRPYQCAVCDFADKKVTLVEQHIRRKHRKSRIHIPVLNMMDEQSDCLRKKMIMIQLKSVETKRLRTSRRKSSLFDYGSLRLTNANGDTLYRCDMCDHEVRVKASIINHRKSHFKFHALGCGYCDYRTSSRFFLQSHNNDVHAGRPLKTRTISRSNDDDSNDSGGKEVSNKEKVASRKRRHSASPAELRTDDKLGDEDDGLEPTFMCQTCGKKMLMKSSMERHVMVTHLGYRPYRCSGCDYSAVSKSTVQTHIAKKHVDASCSVVYKKDERLEATVQTNVVRVADTLEPALQTSFMCAVCKTYKTNSRARIHSHIADEVKYAPHQCAYCQFSSSSRDVVKSHLLEAHPREKLTFKFNERFMLKQRVQELIEQSIVRSESDIEPDFDVYRFNDVLREKPGM